MEAEGFTDAIALLRADHRKVEKLFEQFEEAEDSGRKQKHAEQICNELKVHATIEEEFFYPACKGEVEEDTLSEAYVEHDGAKVLINDILLSSPNDEYFDAKLKVLSEDIKHHVHEEEMPGEGLFAQARASGVDLVALRDQMLARKEELMPQAQANTLPPAVPTAVRMMA